MTAPTTIIVIPDAHAEPGEDTTRFKALGAMIHDEALRAMDEGYKLAVVCLGDFWDMHSLSSYDKGKGSAEGARVKDDLTAGFLAMGVMLNQIPATIRNSIQWEFCCGNHEAPRLRRFVNDNPELDGFLDAESMWFEPLRAVGWRVHDFLEPVEVGGFWFSHYFASGVLNKPIGGLNMGRSLVLKTLGKSVVVGHTHELHMYRGTSPVDGTASWGISAGCFFEVDHAYAGPQANRLYWRGVVVLRNARDGDADVETFTIERLKREHL